ncbi:hypothetical protein PPYR_12019 [Photinus pyralis]|uniref:Ig-like domain-containing protein n=1 Tax=Photinus pyralis TaxID=7054 RepID=A0A5N4ACY0_PHOPY|nr:cilia- and flagella-associated protein 65-like [Photinus pyralis]KAB0795180.1 hypothetical protein PPYR_12019 [Photinus pyralis]
MHLICECTQKLQGPAPLRKPTVDCAQERDGIKTVHFGAFPVGSVTKKFLQIKNSSPNCDTFTVTRDPETNPIYHAFDIKLDNPCVKSGQCLDCVVSFSPQVPNQHYMDYFQISSNTFNSYRICVRGDCIGPSVKLSTKILLFYDTKSGRCLSNTFELANMSNQEVLYQFDVNEALADQEVFKLSTVRGSLKSRDYAYISVKFLPAASKIYALNLVCRIRNHPPLIILLVGVMAPTLNVDPLQLALKQFSDKYPLQGYEGYMYDSLSKVTQKPPFSLSVTHLDFGTVEFEENRRNSQSLVTSLTNHLNDKIEVHWMNENDEVFYITPKTVMIPANESVLYECRFQPNSSDGIFSKLVTGCVFWSTASEEMCVPLNVTLRLLGNSFFANKIWLPLFEIKPSVVIMPPTTPTVQCFTTTILRSSSHLPTSFKFLSPKKSNFVLKPMEGVVNDFEVIVVLLHPDANDKRAYVERWGLELNGRKEDCATLFLKGYAEHPSVIIGDGNVVSFRTVHPGSQDILTVMLKNPTIHTLRYNFDFCGATGFNVNYPVGELVPNEAVYLEWSYTGSLNTPASSRVNCNVQRLKDMAVSSGLHAVIPVTIHTRCVYSELCATPNLWEFDQVEVGSLVSTSFYLFNFGSAPVHFHLTRKDFDLPTSEVTLLPTKGTVAPNEKMQIFVNLKGTIIGAQEIQIVYKVRLSAFSDEIVNQGEERNVFLGRLVCVYPTVQIEDIMSYNFGFLFSKRVLWNMFNIDKLNNILKTIERDETKWLAIYTPDYEIGEKCYFANFVMRNTTNFQIETKLKRKKNCECKPVEKTKGMSFRELVHDCIHRKIANLHLESDLMQPNLTYKMRLDVRYLSHGTSQIVYVMNLSYNRTIVINIHVNVLPEIVTMPSTYFNGFDFKLIPTFIGLMGPPAQAFPLYNNSNFSVDYEVETTPLARVNFEYQFDIFACLNPKGTLPPFTSCSILFEFQPITAEEYEVVVPIKMGESVSFITMKAIGIMEFEKYGSLDDYLPKVSYRNIDNPVELSTDHLVIEPFTVWSFTDRMIFITNQTPDRIVGYSFLQCVQEGVVTVEAQQHKGVLQPKESRPIIIRIRSFDQACILNMQMVCKLLDHSEHIRHAESVHEHNSRQEQLAGQFTITAAGTSFPSNDVKVLPKAENFFLTLSLNICILGVSDRDICFTAEELFFQVPQSRLHINTATIFIDYTTSLLAKESVENVANALKTAPLKHTLDDSKTELVKFAVECILADTIFSGAFNHLLWFANHAHQSYYMQYAIDDEPNPPHTKKSVLKAKRRMGLKKHLHLVKSYLQAPQGPIYQSLFSQLLLDSMHEIFKLGPRKHDDNPREYIYGAMKRKEK